MNFGRARTLTHKPQKSEVVVDYLNLSVGKNG